MSLHDMHPDEADMDDNQLPYVPHDAYIAPADAHEQTPFQKPIDPKQYRCLQKTVFYLNMLYLLLGLLIIAVGVWVVIDRLYYVDVLGQALYHIMLVLFFIAGFFTVILSFVGCFGAMKLRRGLLTAYCIIIIIIFILLVATIVFAFAFRPFLSDTFRREMRRTLLERYGFETEKYHENLFITNSWDWMQKRLNCCAVERYGWTLYQQTNWFKRQIDLRLRAFERQYVPWSCCVKDYEYWDQILDTQRCQNFMSAPPNVNSGAFNGFVYYKGCWEQASQWLTEMSWIIFGICLGVILVLIFGFLSAFKLLRIIPSGDDDPTKY